MLRSWTWEGAKVSIILINPHENKRTKSTLYSTILFQVWFRRKWFNWKIPRRSKPPLDCPHSLLEQPVACFAVVQADSPSNHKTIFQFSWLDRNHCQEHDLHRTQFSRASSPALSPLRNYSSHDSIGRMRIPLADNGSIPIGTRNVGSKILDESAPFRSLRGEVAPNPPPKWDAKKRDEFRRLLETHPQPRSLSSLL